MNDPVQSCSAATEHAAKPVLTLLDAAAHLISRGYRWDLDYERFQRGSWYARITIQKNGRCRLVIT